METNVRFKQNGSVELTHNGKTELFKSVSTMLNRMKELNIDMKLQDVTTEE